MTQLPRDVDSVSHFHGLRSKAAYESAQLWVASTTLETPRLALPAQLIEIKFIAWV